MIQERNAEIREQGLGSTENDEIGAVSITGTIEGVPAWNLASTAPLHKPQT